MPKASKQKKISIFAQEMQPILDTQHLEDELHISRYIIVYKFVLGFFETLLGFGMIVYGDKLEEVYKSIRSEGLFEDPHDLLARITEKVIPYLLEHRGYVVLILMLLGITKMVGSIGLWKRRHWGLDILVILTIFLLPFQISSLVAHPSWIKTGLFIINMFIAFYLVEFKPKAYFVKFQSRVKNRKI